MSLGAYLKAHRKALGERQVEFAARLGVSLGALKKWEADETIPNPHGMKVLHAELGAESWRELRERIYRGAA